MERAGIPDRGPEIELVATLDIAKHAAATAAADKGLPVHLHTEAGEFFVIHLADTPDEGRPVHGSGGKQPAALAYRLSPYTRGIKIAV